MGYFETLEEGTAEAYKVAEAARKKGHDIELEPEIPLAKNLAERVEGLVGPPGVAEKIKNMEATMSREEVAFHVAKEIATSDEVMKADPGNKNQFKIKEEAADQAVRTALSIITEGVVAAPLEGIARVSIKETLTRPGIWLFILQDLYGVPVEQPQHWQCWSLITYAPVWA